MDILFERCAGIDVHTRPVVVCRITRDVAGTRVAETQTCGTTTSDLVRLSDWLTEGGCTHVGLESTGEYWKPGFKLRAGTCERGLAPHCSAHHGRAGTQDGRHKDARDGSPNSWHMGCCAPAASRRIPPHPAASRRAHNARCAT